MTKLDTKFITPFVHATRDVLSMMASINAAAQKPTVTKNPAPYGDIVSIMPMRAEQLQGQLAIVFTQSALLAITSKMIMEECTELDQLVLDTAGEITNIVTGQAKAKLMDNGYSFDMAQPKTFTEADFGNITLVGSRRIIVPFHIDAGNFFVDLGFDAV